VNAPKELTFLPTLDLYVLDVTRDRQTGCVQQYYTNSITQTCTQLLLKYLSDLSFACWVNSELINETSKRRGYKAISTCIIYCGQSQIPSLFPESCRTMFVCVCVCVCVKLQVRNRGYGFTDGLRYQAKLH
jgi:hypothetical protein